MINNIQENLSHIKIELLRFRKGFYILGVRKKRETLPKNVECFCREEKIIIIILKY